MVHIDIRRRTYTSESIISTLRVTSTGVGRHFSGYVLENAKAGSRHDKKPTPAGTYRAIIRTDGRLGWRLELLHVPGHKHIEIHVGNYPINSHGCFLPGTTASKNSVSHSRAAMNEIKSIVDSDAKGSIVVHLVGSNVKK